LSPEPIIVAENKKITIKLERFAYLDYFAKTSYLDFFLQNLILLNFFSICKNIVCLKSVENTPISCFSLEIFQNIEIFLSWMFIFHLQQLHVMQSQPNGTKTIFEDKLACIRGANLKLLC
jgi:hypothetical protein